MPNQEQPKSNSSEQWGDPPDGRLHKSADVNEMLGLKQQTKQASLVNINTMHGDVINLGPLSPEALAEFLATRRRK